MRLDLLILVILAIIAGLFLPGCGTFCPEPIDYRDWFASGARNYCTHEWSKKVVDGETTEEYPCEDVYNSYYNSF